MSRTRMAGEEYFPEQGRRQPVAALPDNLKVLLQAHKLATPQSSRVDLLKSLKLVAQWRQDQSSKPSNYGGKPGPGRPSAGNRTAPLRSPKGLMDLHGAITDFLMDTFGAKPFIPVEKKGRELWITLGWTESTFVRSWVSVTDSENRDVSDWNQRRITNHNGTYTAVLAHDFHRMTRDRAQVIRMWLPALGLAVLFTGDGVNPQPPRAANSRGLNRELKCFPFQTLWEALEVS